MEKDIIKREFVGRNIIVVASKNKQIIGISGKIIGETKSTFDVHNGKKVRKLIKSQIIFETIFQGKLIRIDGKKIAKIPEDRIKSR